MTALLARCGSVAAAILFFVVLMAASAESFANERLRVVLDQAKVAKLPERTATVVVGNPLIADVTLQSGGLLVITGKGYGVTNIIALDRSGTPLSEQDIEVVGPQDKVVIVYRGVNRESYSCAPTCDRRITLGDTPEFFDAALTQTGNRNARAQGGASPAQ